jgi:hypothetical protein
MPISRTVQELLAQKDEIILALENENAALKNEIKALKTKIEFARGVPVEELVKEWTEGTRMNYKDGHDVTTKNGTRLEVKFSNVHTLKSSIKRWNWDSLLGENEKKEFDYLVLAGAKDESYEYPALPYVLFIVPRDAVNDITSRGNCMALNTNLDIVRGNSQKSTTLKRYLVRSQNEFERFKL